MTIEDHVEWIPEYHLDYCFPGDEMGQRLTILVAVERYSRMKKAVVVPSKGSTGMYAARLVLELISECGDKDREVIVKTDQESAIKFLVDDVCMARTGARTIRERIGLSILACPAPIKLQTTNYHFVLQEVSS